MDKERLASDYFQIPAIISFIVEMIVVLTMILFKDLRKLKYMQVVSFMSISSMLGTLGLLFGYVGNNAALCNLQAILTNCGFVSSGFWTVVNTWQLWKVIYTSQIIDDVTMFRLHLFIWLFPIFVSILPFTWYRQVYGIDDDPYSVWCFVSSSAPNDMFLEYFTFWIWIFLSIAIMLILLVSISWRIRRTNLSPTMKGTMRKLFAYPIIFILCWIPPTALSPFAHGYVKKFIKGAILIASSSQGFFITIAFLMNNKSVREKWIQLLLRKNDDDDDDEIIGKTFNNININNNNNNNNTDNDDDELSRNSIDTSRGSKKRIELNSNQGSIKGSYSSETISPINNYSNNYSNNYNNNNDDSRISIQTIRVIEIPDDNNNDDL